MSLARPHLCETQHAHMSMREFYDLMRAIPTSENADVLLIRSHVAYHSGNYAAEVAEIRPSRGHSYRINRHHVVRIVDHYDHRIGVVGWGLNASVTK